MHPVNNASTTLRTQLKQIKIDFLYKINHFYIILYTWGLPSCLRGFWLGAIKKQETEAHNWSQFTIIADVFRDNILLHPASKSHNLPTANAAFIPRPEQKKKRLWVIDESQRKPQGSFFYSCYLQDREQHQSLSNSVPWQGVKFGSSLWKPPTYQSSRCREEDLRSRRHDPAVGPPRIRMHIFQAESPLSFGFAFICPAFYSIIVNSQLVA